MAVPGPPVKVEKSKPSLAESVLYMKSRGGGLKGSKGHGRHSEECDWGNTKEQEGVCCRCGRENHMARNCVVDMPEDVKRKIRDHAHIAEANPDVAASMSFSFVADGGDDPPSVSVMYGSGKHG